MMSNRLVNIHDKALERYIEWVQSYSYYDQDVRTPYQYLDEKGCLPEGEIKALHSEDAFHVLYRVYPGNNQRIVLIGGNPRAKSTSAEWYLSNENEGGQLLATNGDIRKMAEVGKEYWASHAARLHWPKHIDKLSQYVPWLDTKRDYLTPNTFHEVFYYTNGWKFAANTNPNVTNSRTELANPILHKEISVVDPDLIINFGAKSWRYIRNKKDADNAVTPEIQSLDGSPADGGYDGHDDDKAAGGCFDFDGRLVITARHPSFYGSQSIERGLKHATEQDLWEMYT